MTFSKAERRERLKSAQRQLGELDALLVRSGSNLRYFTGVDSGRLLIWRGGAVFWLKEVYFGRSSGSPIKPRRYSENCIEDFVSSQEFGKVGVDGISLSGYRGLRPSLRKVLRPSDVCEQLRKLKSRAEIKVLSRAGEIAADAMRALDQSRLPGMTELELSGLIEHSLRDAGSERPPFSEGMLCLSGPNARYPHAPSSDRKIREGDLVVLDLGAVCDGYHSDMTRTLGIGKVPEEAASAADFIDELKDRAIEGVETGGSISELHGFIKSEIEGEGHQLVHLSGHGVGLDIHEKPSVGPDEDDAFQNGMVFTIEPGIYTEKFGARSEDTVALLNGKARVLTA